MKHKETFRRTPNVGYAVNERRGVVFHHTAGLFPGCVEWLCNPRAPGKPSAHVVILKDGQRVVLADDAAMTHHAGQSEFRGRRWCNHFLLGCEFETRNDVTDPLTEAQIDSALEWLTPRWQSYGWTLADMTHHREVSPGRKVDLNPDNWLRLKAAIAARFPVRGPYESKYAAGLRGMEPLLPEELP